MITVTPWTERHLLQYNASCVLYLLFLKLNLCLSMWASLKPLFARVLKPPITSVLMRA